MTAEQFDAILDRRLALTRQVLAAKAGEYAGPADRLHNFKLAATLTHCSPAEALRGMLVKHWVSLMDLMRKPGAVPPAVLDEKLGDCVNYLCLLEALLLEGRTG